MVSSFSGVIRDQEHCIRETMFERGVSFAERTQYWQVVYLNRGLGVLIANSNAQTGSVLQPGRLLVKRLSPKLLSRGEHTASQPVVCPLPCNHSGNRHNRAISGQSLLSTDCESRHSSRQFRLCQPVFSFLVGAYAAPPASGAEGLEHIGPTQVCFAYRAILQRLTQAFTLVFALISTHISSG